MPGEELRGADIFPSAVEAVVRDLPRLGGEYRLLRSAKAGSSTLTVQVEAVEEVDDAERESLARATTEALRGAVRERIPVQVLNPGALPRTDGLHEPRPVVDVTD